MHVFQNMLLIPLQSCAFLKLLKKAFLQYDMSSLRILCCARRCHKGLGT